MAIGNKSGSLARMLPRYYVDFSDNSVYSLHEMPGETFFVKQEIENNFPKVLRKINLVDVYAVNELRRSSVFNQMFYSPTTLIIVVPLTLLLVKFISTMLVG